MQEITYVINAAAQQTAPIILSRIHHTFPQLSPFAMRTYSNAQFPAILVQLTCNARETGKRG